MPPTLSIRDKIAEIIREASGVEVEVEIFVPENKDFGHYSTNLAMRLAKSRGEDPLKFAKELAAKVREAAPEGFFEEVRTAPPGFINFWLSKETIQNELRDIYGDIKEYGRNPSGKNKTVIVEYSQPNIAKMMHVGHLRTTIIGDALANILEFSGYKVVRWNYLGDWGTQFGKLIAAYKLWGDKKKVEAEPIKELQALYVRFHDEIKQSASRQAELEKLGQEEFRRLEEGDKENEKLWEWFKKESLKEFDRVYRILGVRFDTFIGESFFEKDMKPLVKELLGRGIAKKSEGATIIPLEKFGLPPALIEKADGASLYLARDIANLRYRINKFKPEKILYVVGNEQSLHFEQLFAIAKILGLDRAKLGLDGGAELAHVKYGLVLGESGQKLATREGRTILIDDVIQKAVSLARGIVEKKNPAVSGGEKDKIAEAVGIGALKYNDLKEGRTTDIVFDWKKMLDLTGDSAPYLQYTYARLISIVKKSGKIKKADFTTLNKDTELKLVMKIIEFPAEIVRGAENLTTNNIADYLYKLAVIANRFYETTRVLPAKGGSASGGKEENELRRAALIALVSVTASVLKKGLNILGIKTLERI
jgi:arginyl-tRNA synthetase